jgi:hypothetical protein
MHRIGIQFVGWDTKQLGTERRKGGEAAPAPTASGKITLKIKDF